MNTLKKLFTSLLIIFFSIPLFLTPVSAESDVSTEDPQNINTTESVEETNPASTNGEYWIFHSQSCSHCKKVIKFLEDNNLTDKVVLLELPASQSETNQALWDNQAKMLEVVNYLGLDGGIPLLVKDGYHVSGDTPIISYLTSELLPDGEVLGESSNGLSPLLIAVLSLVGIIVIVFGLTKVVGK